MKERKPIKILTVSILSDGKQIMSEVTRANGMKDSEVISILEMFITNLKKRYGKAS